MERIELSAGGPELSRMVYGVWRLSDGDDTAPQSVLRRIETCLDLGITSFDHADIYGDYACEELFGKALSQKPGLRDSMELITKCDICLRSPAQPNHRVKHYDTRPGHLRGSVEASLTKLGTDRLDVLLLHRPDPLMDAEETAAELNDLVAAGKVLHVGVSNFTPSQFDLLQSRLDGPLVTNQVELSVLETGALLDGTLDQAQRLGRRPMAWSPLAGGRLFAESDEAARRVRSALGKVGFSGGVSIDQVALAWLLALPSRPLPIVGTNKIERIRSAAAAVEIELDRQSWFEIYEAALGGEVP